MRPQRSWSFNAADRKDLGNEIDRVSQLSVTLPPHDGEGLLGLPAAPARGIVLFAHGSGSSRLSPRNTFVAEALQRAGLATLLFDLLTEQEAADRANVFDIPLLADRLDQAATWVGAVSAAARTAARLLRRQHRRGGGAGRGGGRARMCGPSSAVADAPIWRKMRWRRSPRRRC